jgi:hypothetical protein
MVVSMRTQNSKRKALRGLHYVFTPSTYPSSINQGNIMELAKYTPAIINVTGKTKTDRQLSVVNQASGYTKMALANAKGKVGLAARNGIANGGIQAIAKQAAFPTCNYKPVGEYFAAQLGEPMVISNRAAFESLADQFEARIMKIRLSKTGGYVTDKKTGAEKAGATLAKAMELKAIAIEMVAAAEYYTNEAKAEQAKQADAKALSA